MSSSPEGINCGETCSFLFNLDSSITLTARPDDSSVFGGWSGACSGTVDCVVKMDTAKNVTANFEAAQVVKLPLIFR